MIHAHGNGLDTNDYVTRTEFDAFREEWVLMLADVHATRADVQATRADQAQIRDIIASIAKHLEVPGPSAVRATAPSLSDLEDETTLHGTRTGLIVTASSTQPSIPMSSDAHAAVDLVAEARARQMFGRFLADHERDAALVRDAQTTRDQRMREDAGRIELSQRKRTAAWTLLVSALTGAGALIAEHMIRTH